ncbi:MAG: hypothetical protein V4498_06390 [candidate division FCPU426 bacterium]
MGSIGIIIGLVVLLMCIGFVVLMAISEWSYTKTPASTPAVEPLIAEAVKATKPKAKSSPKKKAAAPKKKKKTT